MLGFPKKSETNKKVSKELFYRNIDANAALKRVFVDQIDQIWWRNKLTAETANVESGETTSEIDVFEIVLRVPTLSDEALRAIDAAIPRPLLLILNYDGKYRAAISYKEVATSGTVETSRIFCVGPLEIDALPCKIEGLTLDSVYENFARQIAGDALRFARETNFKEAVDLSKERETLKKKIAALGKKIRNEPQLNRQSELRAQQKKLMKCLEELNNG